MGVPRWVKIAAASLVALAALIFVGLVVLAHTIDLGKYARLAADEVKAATGRELRIGGPVALNIFPLAVVAEDVAFANAAWGSRREMAKVKRVEAGVALLPLLRREVEITRLVLLEPDVLLETDAKGVGNWAFKPAATVKPAGDEGGAPPIDIRSLTVDRGMFTWREGKRRESVQVAIPKLRLERRSLVSELDVDLAAALRGQALAVKGSMGTIRRLLAKDAAWPLDIAIATEGATLAVDGRLDLRTAVPVFDGTIKGEMKDTAGVARLAGGPIGLPVPLMLSAKAKAARGEFTVSPLQVTMGKSTIDGRVTVKTAGPRPHVAAVIKSQLVDLAQAAPAKPGAQGSGARDGRVFSDAPFPLAVMRALDADAELTVARLVTGSRLAVDDLRLHATLEGGRLEVQPFSASIGGGAVGGRLVLDASRPQAATMTVSIDGKNIDLQQVAAAAGHAGTVQGGRLALAANLAGPGASVQRFAGGANGEVRAVMTGPARLSGAALDFGGDALTQIADTLNPSRRAEKGTEVRCAVVRLPVRDGVATVQRTIAIESARVDAVVAGTVDFRKESLDLAIKPTVKEGLGLGAANLAELVRVTGTFANPSIGIDTLASAKAAISVGGAIVTGGLSLLGQSMLSKDTADPHPCQTALGVASSRSAPAGAPVKKDDSDGVLGSIRRLFR